MAEKEGKKEMFTKGVCDAESASELKHRLMMLLSPTANERATLLVKGVSVRGQPEESQASGTNQGNY